MEITEVRIKLVAGGNDKLRAFCSITIDHDFVIRDLKVIEGTKGPFVAMPSRKMTQRCGRCSGKNPHRANFCNECGARLPQPRAGSDPLQRMKLHADIAHPINSRCREVIQRQILEHYSQEMERAKDPHYQPLDLDDFDEDLLLDDGLETTLAEPPRRPELSQGLPVSDRLGDSGGLGARREGGYRGGHPREGGHRDQGYRRHGRSEGGYRGGGYREGAARDRDSQESTLPDRPVRDRVEGDSRKEDRSGYVSGSALGGFPSRAL